MSQQGPVRAANGLLNQRLQQSVVSRLTAEQLADQRNPQAGARSVHQQSRIGEVQPLILLTDIDPGFHRPMAPVHLPFAVQRGALHGGLRQYARVAGRVESVGMQHLKAAFGLRADVVAHGEVNCLAGHVWHFVGAENPQIDVRMLLPEIRQTRQQPMSGKRRRGVEHQLVGLLILPEATDAEGGGIEVDGHGTAIMTESCWINENRNPGWSKADVEAELKARLGLRKIIWLPGIKGKDITDAHVDFYARFVTPGVVIANLDTDPRSYDNKVTLAHLEILKRATDADGRPLQIHTVSPPLKPRKTKFNKDNDDFAAGYINYFVINGAVIAPEFGDKDADKKAFDLLKKLYPNRDVVKINIDAIAAGGGGIHCVTSHQPA